MFRPAPQPASKIVIPFETLPRFGALCRVDAEPRIDEGADEPGPYRSLVISRVTGAYVAKILGLIIWMVWGKRAEPHRGEQALAYDLEQEERAGHRQDSETLPSAMGRRRLLIGEGRRNELTAYADGRSRWKQA